jgi:superfamily II DNA or RNA helicase
MSEKLLLSIERKRVKITTDNIQLFDDLRNLYSIKNKNKRYCKYSQENISAITPTGLFHYGLTREIITALRKLSPGIDIDISPELRAKAFPFSYCPTDIISPPNKKYVYRDYQEKVVRLALAYGRGVFTVPTGGGKSLILIGLILNIYHQHPSVKTILVLVPTIQLVKQMYSDLVDYGMDADKLQMFSAFSPTLTSAPIIIANRQYLEGHSSELPIIDMVIVDEVHSLKRGSEVSSYVNSLETSIRFGMTGTLPENIEDVWNVKGIIGPVLYTEKIVTLQEQKILSDIKIVPIRINIPAPPLEVVTVLSPTDKFNMLLKQYDRNKPMICYIDYRKYKISRKLFKDFMTTIVNRTVTGDMHIDVTVTRKYKTADENGKEKKIERTIVVPLIFDKMMFLSKNDYHKEWDFTENFALANAKITELTVRLKGNTLLLFDHTEHGHKLFEAVQSTNKHYIDGEVDIEDREDIRKLMEESENCIITANTRCFAVGINIRRINNIIFSSGGKGLVKVIQAIGRGLRTHATKDRLNLIDISFDKKYSEMHFMQRIRLYRKFYKMTIEKVHEINLRT